LTSTRVADSMILRERRPRHPVLNETATNTLDYDPVKCVNCGMCWTVCPHGVFAPNGTTAQLVRHEACMECGACELNCPTGAIAVDSGVGCAAAMIKAALTGQAEPTCGKTDETASCCETTLCC
jgi:NAD-dependent dihydropyrimidine dehydrogenase PreA subunit